MNASSYRVWGVALALAGVGRLMLFLYPTITVLLSALFLGKRVNRRDVLVLGGVMLVTIQPRR